MTPSPRQLDALAERLYADIMAPLVLGGPMRPTHAIGARAALALGDRSPLDSDLEALVQQARVRRARTLVPVDALASATGAEWALAAALHDVAQSANPGFDAPLRRGAAARILRSAATAIEHVAPPATLHEAISRHTWFARLLEIARTDTSVSWWTGSRVFLGIEPPARLQAWPSARRVRVARASRPLLELAPLAVDRERLSATVAALLARTPMTDLATCARPAPAFAWHDAALALVATPAGRNLTMRVLAAQRTADVDLALGRATREMAAERRALPAPVLEVLADRAIAEAQGHIPATQPAAVAADADLARCLGAAAALRSLDRPESSWPEAQRQALRAALEPAARKAPAMAALVSMPAQ